MVKKQRRVKRGRTRASIARKLATSEELGIETQRMASACNHYIAHLLQNRVLSPWFSEAKRTLYNVL